MGIEFRAIGIWVGVLCLVLPLAAHHSLEDAYDLSDTVALAGTVSGVRWSNPHVRIELETRGENGDVSMWSVEFGAPSRMERGGVDRTDIRLGDEIRVDAWVAQDASHSAAAQSLMLSDGQTFTDDLEIVWSRGNESNYVIVRPDVSVP